ncbi:hypothetical protein ACJJTC_006678 [Scirpophaga incertulas]
MTITIIHIDVFGNKHVNQLQSEDNYKGGKIVGGYNASIEEMPYQVLLLLQRGNKFYQCGGSIVTTKVVLTAAHCVIGVSLVYVIVGTTLASVGGVEYNTTRYVKHPQYSRVSRSYDIAVVKLNRPIRLDGVTSRKITLAAAGTDVLPGTNLLVSGWGATAENGNATDQLMAVIVPTVAIDECRKAYPYSRLTDRQICAGVPEGGKDSCQGDSGGPAVDVATGIQVGVVSFGTGCARPDVPGVYIKVSSFRDWLKMVANI